eukprot:404404-Prymnesium_polylepis.2
MSHLSHRFPRHGSSVAHASDTPNELPGTELGFGPYSSDHSVPHPVRHVLHLVQRGEALVCQHRKQVVQRHIPALVRRGPTRGPSVEVFPVLHRRDLAAAPLLARARQRPRGPVDRAVAQDDRRVVAVMGRTPPLEHQRAAAEIDLDARAAPDKRGRPRAQPPAVLDVIPAQLDVRDRVDAGVSLELAQGEAKPGIAADLQAAAIVLVRHADIEVVGFAVGEGQDVLSVRTSCHVLREHTGDEGGAAGEAERAERHAILRARRHLLAHARTHRFQKLEVLPPRCGRHLPDVQRAASGRGRARDAVQEMMDPRQVQPQVVIHRADERARGERACGALEPQILREERTAAYARFILELRRKARVALGEQHVTVRLGLGERCSH